MEFLPVAGLSLIAAVLAALAVWILFQYRLRRNPLERERRRRITVNQLGRLGDAFITDASADAVFYSYSIHGVSYAASQDVAHLREHLPGDPTRLIGPATLKYSPRNPANSIVVCEHWSGLREKSKELSPL